MKRFLLQWAQILIKRVPILCALGMKCKDYILLRVSHCMKHSKKQISVNDRYDTMTQVTATEHQELQFTQEPIDDERKILRFLFTSFLWLVLLLFSDLFVTEMCVDCVHNDVHCLIVASTVKQIDRPGTCQTFYICCLTWNQVVTHCGRGLLRQEVPSHRGNLETADKQE